MRRTSLNVAWATWALLAATAYGEAQRPNIVLVMADDQGWGDMGYNGHPVLKTPHFDQAAAEMLRFDRFYAAAPVCSPTRASVLTGRHPNRAGVFQWGYPLPPGEVTLAGLLAEAGYRCGHFGKWHLGSVRRTSLTSPGAQGFHEWLSAPNFYDNDATLSRRGTAVSQRGESSAIAVDAAIDWIAAQSRTDQPFLAVVWFGSPHVPHRASEPDRSLYTDQTKRRQHFYGEITGMDRAFGRLRQALAELGEREQTLLWYCSDNGGLPEFGATGGRGDKGDIYEGGLRVPALLEWPERVRSPRVTSVPATTCDILPTILQAAGVNVPTSRPLDGVSLLALLEGEMHERPAPIGFWDYDPGGRPVRAEQLMQQLLAAQYSGEDLPPPPESQQPGEFAEQVGRDGYFPGHAAWLDGRWKLYRVQHDREPPVWELYNLAQDPNEQMNLIDVQPDRVAAMKRACVEWLTSVVASRR